MANEEAIQQSTQSLRMFWWAFAVRGGLAVIFAVVLLFVSSFLGIFFFDPVTLLYMGLLLGSYVLGNGLLLGVAAIFAFEHHLHLWWLTLCESSFALLLAVYIGFSLLMSPESLALLAGLHALGTGIFQVALAIRMREDRLNLLLPGLVGVISVAVGIAFLTHIHQAPRATTRALSGYELLCGLTSLAFAFRLQR